MNGGKGFTGVILAIVAVAMVTAVLSSQQGANTIRAIGEAIGGTLRAAMGR
jgi:hypothetical protein